MVLTTRPDAAAVAGIVLRRDDLEFADQLKAANRSFVTVGFEAELVAYLRRHPQLVDAWQSWSEDQRWTPTAVVSGTDSGWMDTTGAVEVRTHPDRATATADFIHRMAAWLDERRILHGQTS
jgi:hypothetical protein